MPESFEKDTDFILCFMVNLQVSGRDRKFALTSEDLLVALTDQGIRVKKPPFYGN